MAMNPTALALSTCLALSAGCAHSFRGAERGGPAWQELSSGPFSVRTDARDEVARARLSELGVAARALSAVFPELPRSEERLIWLAPAALDGMDDFANDDRERRLGILYPSLFGEAVLVGLAVVPATEHLLVYRALASFGLHRLKRCPPWLRSGLVDYLETARVDSNGSAIVVGDPHPHLAAELTRLRSVPPVDWTLRFDPSSRVDRKFRETSWILVHYLVGNHREAFRGFLRALAAGEEPGGAFSAAFPSLTTERLDAEVNGYWASGKLLTLRFPVPPSRPAAVSALPLSDADVHAMRAEAMYYAPVRHTPGAISSEAREALALEPAHPLALSYDLSLDAGRRAERLRKAAVAKDADGRTALLFWATSFLAESGAFEHGVSTPRSALHRLLAQDRRTLSPDLLAALERAAALLPGDAYASSALAAVRLQSGRAAEALALVEPVLQRSPGWPEVLDIKAEALIALGRCPEAAALEALALGRLVDLRQPQGAIFYGHVNATGLADLEARIRKHAQASRECAGRP